MKRRPSIVLGGDISVSPKPGTSLTENYNQPEVKKVLKNKNATQSTPANFGDAMALFLNDGHCLDDAIKLASEQYPLLYKEYCSSIIDPTR